jgi:hypothetical protein
MSALLAKLDAKIPGRSQGLEVAAELERVRGSGREGTSRARERTTIDARRRIKRPETGGRISSEEQYARTEKRTRAST